MVSRAGLCCLMYCGAEDTRKHHHCCLRALRSWVLGMAPVCLQGLRGRGVVVKGTGAGLPGCPEDTGWGEGLGCHPQGMGLEQSRPPATQGL